MALPLKIPVCKMAEAEHPTSWSDLPTDLADLVLCRLPAYSDRVCFGAVCRHWNYSLKQHRLPPPLPCLMFSDGTLVSLPGGESFQFCDSTKYHSSCGEWLVFSRDGTCSVMNPFSKISLTLPNLSSVRFIDEPVQIINGHATQNGDISQQSLCMDAELTVQKVIVGSVLLVAAIVDIEPLSHTVALCRPGADSWLVSEFGSKRLLMDMLFVEGKLYAIDEYMDFWAIDVGQDSDSGKLIISRIKCLIDSPSVTVSLIQNGVTSISYFLVESHGAQLLVRRTIFGRRSDNDRGGMSIEPVGIEFKVFEADFNSSQWVGVISIGDDRALFLGRSYSKSVCVSQYNLKEEGMLRGNCIIFLDDGTCDWFWKGMTGSHAIYDMSDGRTYSIKSSGLFEGRKGPVTWLFPQ